MRPAAVAPVLVALVLGGCGQTAGSTSKDFSGEEAKVADVVGNLASDGKKRKPADICDELLAKSLKDKIAATGAKCSTEMRKAIEDADGFDVKVTDVRVSGASARAQVEADNAGDTITRTFTLADERGWRIADFGSDDRAPGS